MDEITLCREALTHLRDRVTLLYLLVGMPALVGDFYNEFRHLLVFCYGVLIAPV